MGTAGVLKKGHSEPFGFAQDRLREESLLAVTSSVLCAKDPSSASRRTQGDTAGRFFNSPTVTYCKVAFRRRRFCLSMAP